MNPHNNPYGHERAPGRQEPIRRARSATSSANEREVEDEWVERAPLSLDFLSFFQDYNHRAGTHAVWSAVEQLWSTLTWIVC